MDFRQAEAEFFADASQLVFELEKDVGSERERALHSPRPQPGRGPRGRAVELQPIPPEVPAGLPAALLDGAPMCAKRR